MPKKSRQKKDSTKLETGENERKEKGNGCLVVEKRKKRIRHGQAGALLIMQVIARKNGKF